MPKLKATVKTLDEVPEAARELYVQVGEDFVLDVDDTEYKTRINEFRTNNIDLQKLNAQLKQDADEAQKLREVAKEYEGIDPDKAREALEKLKKIEEKQLMDAGKIDELLHQRTENMRSDYEGKISALTKTLDERESTLGTMKDRLKTEVIDNRLQVAVGKVAAVRKGAMRDVLSRGREEWTLDDEGNPVPRGPDGNVLYGKDGQSPITMEEWAQGLVKETPYLFEPSAGGGGPGDLGGGEDARTVGRDYDSLRDVPLEDIASGKVRVANQ